mmetsp:Transcript_90191/g.291551  ORF Transcript_90191/g.291551 Transcript_90191/m.291551 type:complete len:204 (+) Transcript_90191:965-1576(+)
MQRPSTTALPSSKIRNKAYVTRGKRATTSGGEKMSICKLLCVGSRHVFRTQSTLHLYSKPIAHSRHVGRKAEPVICQRALHHNTACKGTTSPTAAKRIKVACPKSGWLPLIVLGGSPVTMQRPRKKRTECTSQTRCVEAKTPQIEWISRWVFVAAANKEACQSTCDKAAKRSLCGTSNKRAPPSRRMPSTRRSGSQKSSFQSS